MTTFRLRHISVKSAFFCVLWTRAGLDEENKEEEEEEEEEKGERRRRCKCKE